MTPHLPTARSPRYHSLDLWRGVACLVVAVFHATFYLTDARAAGSAPDHPVSLVLLRLWIGVPFFFVISGYCISASADGLRRRPLAIGTYFRRRFRRIFPPWWVVVAGSAALVGVVEAISPGLFADAVHPIASPVALTPAQWLGNLTLVEGWRAHVGGPEVQFFMGHAWTLVYEEQFYAVVGLLLLVSRRHFFTNALLLSAAVALLVGARWMGWVSAPVDGFFFDGRWLFFAAGILVYWLLNHGDAWHRRAGAAALSLPALAVLALRPEHLAGRTASIVQEGVAALLFAAVLLAVHRYDATWTTQRALRPLYWCGVRCYSIYLVHWPIVKLLSHALHGAGVQGLWPTLLVTVPVCLVATVAAGDVFHRLVERRFLNAPLSAPARVADADAPGVVAGPGAYPAFPFDSARSRSSVV